MWASLYPCYVVSLTKRAFISYCGFFTLGYIIMSHALAIYGLILIYLSYISKLVTSYILNNFYFLNKSVVILNFAFVGEILGD